jgi:MFS family permease
MSYLEQPDLFGWRGDGGALIITVCATSLVTTLSLGLYDVLTRPVGPYDSSGLFIILGVVTFLVMTAIGIVVATAIGLPLTSFLAKRGLERWSTYPLAGLVAGAVTAAFVLGSLLAGWFGAIPGLIAGTIWWRFHRRHFQPLGD